MFCEVKSWMTGETRITSAILNKNPADKTKRSAGGAKTFGIVVGGGFRSVRVSGATAAAEGGRRWDRRPAPGGFDLQQHPQGKKEPWQKYWMYAPDLGHTTQSPVNGTSCCGVTSGTLKTKKCREAENFQIGGIATNWNASHFVILLNVNVSLDLIVLRTLGSA